MDDSLQNTQGEATEAGAGTPSVSAPEAVAPKAERRKRAAVPSSLDTLNPVVVRGVFAELRGVLAHLPPLAGDGEGHKVRAQLLIGQLLEGE